MNQKRWLSKLKQQRVKKVEQQLKVSRLPSQEAARHPRISLFAAVRLIAVPVRIVAYFLLLANVALAFDLKSNHQQHEFESAIQTAIDSGKLIADDMHLKEMVVNGMREKIPSAIYLGLLLTIKSQSALNLGDIAVEQGIQNASLLLVVFTPERLNFERLNKHVQQLESYASPNLFLVRAMALNGIKTDNRSLDEVLKSVGRSAKAAAQYGSPIALQFMSGDVNRTPEEHAFACNTLSLLEVQTETQWCSDVPTRSNSHSSMQKVDVIDLYRAKLIQLLGAKLYDRYRTLCETEFSDLGEPACFDYMSVVDAFCTVQLRNGTDVWRSEYSVCDRRTIAVLTDLFIRMNNDMKIVGLTRR